MKRHRNITVIIVLILILIPAIANAVGFSISSVAKRPLGGKIIRSGQNADIACATISGPIFVRPFNIATLGPYFVRNSNLDHLAENLKSIQTELAQIRSSFSYNSGSPSQAMQDREKELVEKMKEIRGSISNVSIKKPLPGKYILGNYSLVPDLGTCYNPETGVPIPAFEIKPYGVSR